MIDEPKIVYIGYWKYTKFHLENTPQIERNGQELTWPVENSATVDQSKIITKLKGAMKSGHMLGYRGWSNCRICKKNNGTKELQIQKDNIQYRIPVGYVHYLEDHNVAVDPLLEKIL